MALEQQRANRREELLTLSSFGLHRSKGLKRVSKSKWFLATEWPRAEELPKTEQLQPQSLTPHIWLPSWGNWVPGEALSTHGGSQPSLTTVPGELTPFLSSVGTRHIRGAHTYNTYIHAGKIK